MLEWLTRTRATRWLKRRAIGADPQRLPRRLALATVFVLLATTVAGAWYLLTKDVDPQASSIGYLRPLLRVVTSPWLPAVAIALITLQLQRIKRRKYADLAANVTGISRETIRRLAAEATAPDGTRVVVTNRDEPADIERRITEALETGEDEQLAINPDALQVAGDEDTPAIDERRLAGDLRIGARVASALADRLDHAGADVGSMSETLPDDRDDEDVDDELRDVLEDEWLVEWKHARMDLAASISWSSLAWWLALPAAIVFLAELLVARIWVVPWLYPVMLAVALLAGLAHYGIRQWWRSRRLASLRQEREGTAWDDLAVLVKAVERPETTMHYGFLAGRRYAHPDREVFARELATRAHEKVNGAPISPSIMEKYAHQLEQLYPDLYAYRDDEKERIMALLRETVRDSEIGLVPKQKLIEDVIENDVSGGLFGAKDAPLIGRAKSEGFDPALVREAYRELVPAALVEQTIEIPTRREGVDDTAEITAVRLREDPLPPAFSEVRSQFSSQFSNYVNWEPLYALPDVDDRLDEEPIYVGGDGAPAEVSARV